MTRARSLLLLVFVAGWMTACVDERAPAVDVGEAVYTGTWQHNGEVAAFLGVPFAQPPNGVLRWQPPKPLMNSQDRTLTSFAPACMQGDHMVAWYRDLITQFGGDVSSFLVPEFSEDCLYLNIWSPAPGKAAKLPVMVWIHGGGHRGGWAYEPNYIGDELARRDVVVVSIAYRLDVFGFFSHPDLPESNFGLLDQIAALQWVQKHIGQFGGDPTNVTVFGESAGAASAGYLLTSPKARGLFQRLIHQSAGYEFVHRDRRSDFLEAGVELAKRVLPSDSNGSIDELRNAPPGDVLQAAKQIFASYQPDAVVDGDTLLEPPVDSLRAGRLMPVDLLIGSNADEWKMYLDASTNTADIEKWLTVRELTDADEINEELAADRDLRRSLDRLETAENFICPSLLLAEQLAALGKQSYIYYFDRVRPGDLSAAIGAYHGAEIPYVFNKVDDWLPAANRDRELADAMGRYWTEFAKRGEPVAAGYAEWPPFAADSAMTLRIGNEIHAIEHPERRLCNLLPAP